MHLQKRLLNVKPTLVRIHNQTKIITTLWLLNPLRNTLDCNVATFWYKQPKVPSIQMRSNKTIRYREQLVLKKSRFCNKVKQKEIFIIEIKFLGKCEETSVVENLKRG